MNKQRLSLSLATILFASLPAASCIADDGRKDKSKDPGRSKDYVLRSLKHAAMKHKYIVNLMWINRQLDNGQRYIYPAKDRDGLQKNFLDHIFKWAAISQEGAVYVWFDSKLTPPQAVENTKALIEEYIQKHPGMAPIQLRDIRTVPKVVEYPEVFSEKVPVYLRADLLRPIVGLHLISTNETPYFVYADLDMKPLSQEQLFDYETQRNLQYYGMVMARVEGSYNGMENGFQMISNQNPRLLAALEWCLVASCIDRAQSLLEEGFKVGTGMAANQIVYTRYDDMIGCFWHLEGYDDDKMLDDCRQYRNRLFPTKDIKFIGFSSAHADFKDTNTEDYKGE